MDNGQQRDIYPTDPEQLRLKDLKIAQTLNTVAIIAGPVSLLIGGLLLSIVSLVCALIARSKIKRVLSVESPQTALAQRMKSSNNIACIVAIIAFIFGLYTFIVVLTTMMTLLQTGDYQSLMNALGGNGFGSAGSSGSPSAPDVSIWDR